MPNSLEKVFSIDNLLSQKLSLVEAATKRKQEEIDPDVAALKEYWADHDARLETRIRESDRLTSEWNQDIPAAVARTTVGLVGGTAALALSAGTELNPAIAAAGDNAGRDMLRRGRDALVRKTAEIDRKLAGKMSQVSQLNDAEVARQNQLDMQQNAAVYDAAVADGAVPFVAGARELGANIIDGGGNLLENPTALSNAVIGQVPTLGIGVGANLAVRAEQVAARAALMAEARGVLAGQVTKEARDQLATRNLMAAVGATEAGGTFQDAAGSILDPEVSIEQLAQAYPEIQERLAAGEDEVSIRGDLASKAGLTAAAIQGPLAAIASRVAARFELNPVGLGDDATKGLVKKSTYATADVLKEGLEETIQSGGGQLASNLGQIAAGNEQIDALDDVGTAAGAGGVAGMGMAAGFKAPGLAGSAVAAGAKGAYRVTAKAISERYAKLEAEVEAQTAESRKAADERRAADVARAEQRAAEANVQMPLANVGEEPALSPETRADLGAADEEVTGYTGMERATKLLAAKDMPAERREELSFYVVKQLQVLGETQAKLTEQLDGLPADAPERAQLEALNESIRDSMQAPAFAEAVQFVSSLSPEALGAKLNAIPDDFDPTTAAPEQVQAVEIAKVALSTSPEKFTAEQGKKMGALFQSLGDAKGVAQAKLVVDVAEVKAAYEQAAEQIQQSFPGSKKATNVVTREITDKGFAFKNAKGDEVRLNSVADHIAGVSQAMALGEVQVAAKRMASLMNFAVHMSNKAKAFDAGAMALIDADLQNTKGDAGRKALDYSTLDANGKPSKAEPAFVSLASDGGQALVDTIFADADAVTGAFNSLVQAYPAAAKILKAAALQGPGKPQWKSYVKPETAAEPVVEQAAPAQEAKAEAAPAKPAAASPASGEGARTDAGEKQPKEARTLADALAMDDDAYIAAVNPDGKVTDPDELEGLEAVGLDKRDLPKDGKQIGKLTDRKGTEVRLIQAGNGNLFITEIDGTPLGSVTNEGGQTMNFVVPEARGRGIGTMLIKEWVRANPFAQSGGFSPAGERARRRALQELRAEAAPPEVKKPTTVAERFRGLIESVGEGIGSLNQFVQGFKLAKSSRSPLARMENPTQEMLEVITQARENGDLSAIKDLFVEELRTQVVIGENQAEVLQTLFGDVVPNLVDQLNANLKAAIAVKKNSRGEPTGILKRFITDPVREWTFQNRKTLHVTQKTADNKSLEYQPEVAEAMALAAVHWVIANINNPPPFDETKIMERFPELSPEQRQIFREAYFFEQPARDLARQITQIMGVAANPDAPLNYSDGLAKQLALDAFKALESMGVLTIRTEKLDSEKTLQFLQLNKDKDAGMQRMRDLLDKPSLLTRLLLPDSKDIPSIGKPPSNPSRRVRGTGTPHSAQQQKNIDVLEKIPFKLNMSYIGLASKMGSKLFELTGYVPVSEDNLDKFNKQDYKSVSGINAGIVQAGSNLADLMEAVQAYAEANDMAVEDVPVYYAWEVISNGRMMQTAAGPQSNKHLREAVTANHSTIDLNNAQHQIELGLAVAQALGVKTEQKPNLEALDELQRMFAEEPLYAQLFEELRALDATETPDEALVDSVFQSMKALNVSTERAAHALLTWARFEVADPDVPFQHALAFELDGKTDGPINAMVHFGLHGFSEHMLTQLKQGGLIIDEPTKPTLNQQGKIGDLYETSAKLLEDAIPGLLADAKPAKRQKLLAARDMLVFLDHAKWVTPEDGRRVPVLKIGRSVAKHGVMATNYGSGHTSIVKQLVFGFSDKFHAELSRAMREGVPLEPELVRMVETLVGRKLPRLSDPSQYRDFVLNKGDIDAITASLLGSKKEPGLGRVLVNGIRSEMAPIVKTFELLYKATGLQVVSMRRAFTTAYRAKHAELVAAGELLPNDALSQNQERELLTQFADQMPLFKLMIAAGNGEGLNVSQRDFAGELQLDGRRPEKVEAISGGLSMDINATHFPDPGVRGAALFTIALGDATMMAQMFMQAGNMLNVYDGLEVSVGEIAQRALQVNKAVWDGWQFDAMGAAADSFEQLDTNFDAWSREALLEAYGALYRPWEAPMEAKDLAYEQDGKLSKASLVRLLKKDVAQYQWQLREMAIMNQATKLALGKRNIAVDHMSGGQRPFVIENEDAEGNTVAMVQQDAVRIAMEMRTQVRQTQTSAMATPDKELSDRLQLTSRTGKDPVRDLAELDKAELQLMLATYTFPSKLQRFVFDQIEHLLPDNLRVFIGTPEAIAQAKAREFEGVELGGDLEVGAYYEDTIFLSAASPETLVHELVHATTLGLINRYYLEKAKGLTAAQREAVRALEALAKDFVTREWTGLPRDTLQALERAQDVIAGHLAEENIPFAVNEFMAWTLTNRNIAAALQKTSRLDSLKQLAKSVLKHVRKLLGLPNNQPIESFLEQTLGQFHRLVRRPTDTSRPALSQMALFQSLDGAENVAHERHLEDTMRLLERVMNGVPAHLRTIEQHQRGLEALVKASELKEEFLDAGFVFSDKEAMVFSLVQAVFASAAELDPITMTAFQEIHRQVMTKLSPRDFLTDPSNNSPTGPEWSMAQKRYNALASVYAEDASGRSNLLANFVGLAMVHEPLRKKLATMTMPKETLKRETVDETLRNGVRVAFDKLSNTVLHIGGNTPQMRSLDTLINRLAVTQEELGARLAKTESPIEKAEARVGAWQRSLDNRVSQTLSERVNGERNKTKVDGYINLVLAGARGLLSDDGADAFQRGVTKMINTMQAPKFFTELVAEIMGMGGGNEGVAMLLNRSKHAVARVRQRLREEGPGMVRDLFKGKFKDTVWQSLHLSAGRTDLQTLMSTYSLKGIADMVADEQVLADEIARTVKELDGKHSRMWDESANDLATWMVQRSNPAVFLRRNARAIAMLAGSGIEMDQKLVDAAEPLVDRLVSLYALQKLPQADRTTLAEMLRNEPEGMTGMLRLMRSLVEQERGKPGSQDQHLNAWKGHVPVSTDPRTDLVLAGPDKGAELLKRGYRLVAQYQGDALDRSDGMAYYATSLNPGKFELVSGGKPTFNQGAMQTVTATVMGVDRLTGQTQDSSVHGLISNESTVEYLTARKRKLTRRSGEQNLIPIFDSAGKIEAYERVMDHAFLEQHLRVNTDLSQAIGAWMGRQVEEQLARSFNAELVDVLHANWQQGMTDKLEGEYVDVAGSKDPTIRDAWNAIPRETQAQLKAAFGGDVMIRKDMINNAIGYRSASVADVFTGVSNLAEPVRAGLEKAALGMFGLNAYRYLYTAERTWQGLVGSAKDWIVVRSGVVAFANGFANQFQLLQMGVPLKTLLPTQLRKIKETEQYLRNEKRIAQLQVAIQASNQVGKKRELERDQQMLRDENSRLSIWPLIRAGELPSITEGLSELDQYSLLNDAVGWVEGKMENLPKGLSTAARYAVISKDTALYQGLNRMIQFGDFMAKATLYDQLISQGLSNEEALQKVSESFVNYNLMAGRSRDYLETMGLTWFLNYKLRIQKIVLRNIRENPLRFLMAGAGAEVVGADSLVTSSAPNANWAYGFGPGPFFKAHNMILWDQLF